MYVRRLEMLAAAANEDAWMDGWIAFDDEEERRDSGWPLRCLGVASERLRHAVNTKRDCRRRLVVCRRQSG